MEFVYATSQTLSLWGPTGSSVMLHPNDVWFADDPLVLARPELFSSTPVVVHSTQGRESPPATPLKRVKAAARG